MFPCQGHLGHLKMSIMEKCCANLTGEGEREARRGEGEGEEGEREGYGERKGFWSPVVILLKVITSAALPLNVMHILSNSCQ